MGSPNAVRPAQSGEGENVKRDASQNYGSIIDVTYGGEGATVTMYVYTAEHQFVTLARTSFGRADLELMLNRIAARRRELDNATEPLW